MAATPIPIERTTTAVVWDGTNGADVVEALNQLSPLGDFTLVSEDESRLVVNGDNGYGAREFSVDVGGAFISEGPVFSFSTDAAAYHEMYRESGLPS